MSLSLCIADAAGRLEPVTVSGTDDGSVFASSSGEAFVLADVLVPGARDEGDVPQNAAAAEGSHYLAYPVGAKNRWGLSPAWVVSEREGRRFLVQQSLLISGEAMVAPDLGTPDCLADLKRSEATARRTGRGLWQGRGVFSTRQPDALLRQAGHYVVAEGRIVSLGKTARTRYLNFGFRWKSDFTVTLKMSEEEAFDAVLAEKGMSVADLAGAAVRVRGVIQVRDGPHMELTHPGQLDVIDFKKGKE